MERCKRCETSSWMVSLTDNGLCRRCNLIVVNRVQVAAEAVCRSLAMLRQDEDVEGRLRHVVRILRHAKLLARYEEMEIDTIRPAPSRLIDLFEEERTRLRRAVEGKDYSSAVRFRASDPDSSALPSPSGLELVDPMDPLGSFDRVRRRILEPETDDVSE